MSETLSISWVWLAPAFLAGMALGLFYFRALWATVKRMHAAHRPVLLLLGSYAVRTLVVLVGFYVVLGGYGGGHWERLVSSLIGFLVVRQIMVRRLGPTTQAGE